MEKSKRVDPPKKMLTEILEHLRARRDPMRYNWSDPSVYADQGPWTAPDLINLGRMACAEECLWLFDQKWPDISV